jgi:hypothetical protein
MYYMAQQSVKTAWPAVTSPTWKADYDLYQGAYALYGQVYGAEITFTDRDVLDASGPIFMDCMGIRWTGWGTLNAYGGVHAMLIGSELGATATMAYLHLIESFTIQGVTDTGLTYTASSPTLYSPFIDDVIAVSEAYGPLVDNHDYTTEIVPNTLYTPPRVYRAEWTRGISGTFTGYSDGDSADITSPLGSIDSTNNTICGHVVKAYFHDTGTDKWYLRLEGDISADFGPLSGEFMGMMREDTADYRTVHESPWWQPEPYNATYGYTEYISVSNPTVGYSAGDYVAVSVFAPN